MTICDVNKIDSNVTGLSFAEEVCPKILPAVANGDLTDPIWYGLEPNSYSDFGGDISTVARQPISATRQRSKGTVTDVSASGGFNTDMTQNNMQRLAQGFFFNDLAQKPTTKPINGLLTPITSVANSDKSFNAASGLGIFLPGHIVKASNFAAANNGRLRVTSVTGTKVIVNETVVDEAAPSQSAATPAVLHAVGFRFASGELTLTAAAAGATLTIAGLASATGTLTTTGNAVADETVTIGGVVYTWKAAPTTVANQVKVGANATASILNLANAINRTGTPGTDYGSLTVIHPTVKATAGASTLVLTAKTSGSAGNALATTETMTNASFGAATLTSGAGSTGWLALGVAVGEWLFVGGDDAANTAYTTTSSTNKPGFARVASVTDNAIVFDQHTWTPQTDVGTGRTIEVFFGSVLKNGTKSRTYQLEMTLGADSVGTQAQYVEGAIPNEFTLNLPSTDKINADLAFIGLNAATKTGTEGLKTGTRIPALGESAFNTSLDLYRVRMNVIDPANANNAALFGFVSEASITINNNASANKALGFLGGFSVSVGNFDAGGSLTAYFATVDAIRAIRNNSDVAFNVIAARANAGFIFDMPLLGLGGGRANVELNAPITIPLENAAAVNKNGYTLLANWFSYLPTVAMPS